MLISQTYQAEGRVGFSIFVVNIFPYATFCLLIGLSIILHSSDYSIELLSTSFYISMALVIFFRRQIFLSIIGDTFNY